MSGNKVLRICLVTSLVALVFLGAFFLATWLWPEKEPVPAPEIICADREGRLHTLAEQFGKTGTVLIFFDTDHRHSREAMQRLVPKAEELGVSVYAVCMAKGTPDEIAAQMKELKMPTPPLLLFDAEGKAAKAYNVSNAPCIYFIDKNGNIVDAYLGAISEDSALKELKEIA